jgi:hypothetical protein
MSAGPSRHVSNENAGGCIALHDGGVGSHEEIVAAAPPRVD